MRQYLTPVNTPYLVALAVICGPPLLLLALLIVLTPAVHLVCATWRTVRLLRRTLTRRPPRSGPVRAPTARPPRRATHATTKPGDNTERPPT